MTEWPTQTIIVHHSQAGHLKRILLSADQWLSQAEYDAVVAWGKQLALAGALSPDTTVSDVLKFSMEYELVK